jgi:hypothetical protein
MSPAGTLFYQAKWQKAGAPIRILPFYHASFPPRPSLHVIVL